jgi:L-aspartate oxidase
MITKDFLVVGSGLAGLVCALRAAAHGSVAMLAKRGPLDANTAWAQGGIAAAVGEDDAPGIHAQDTLACGVGICRPAAVELMVRSGPGAIHRLEELGVQFAHRLDGAYDLGREGGHSRRRVLHAGDITGGIVMDALTARVREDPRIEVFTDHVAVDLILEQKVFGGERPPRCLGAYALDATGREIHTFAARATILATGGSGKVYTYTSNPDVATGDGLAMAWRAGCRVANLEFVQFHPTVLYHPEARSFLISEAVRGEGGHLTTRSGERLPIPHPLGDLAPRDIVARSIDREMKRRGDRSVLLHLEHLDAGHVLQRFPNIYETCLKLGIDITRQPIPVVPAAHYQCGGVVTDLEARTDLPGLYAAGEVAFTGLHGANRLASNSLLEALVMGERAAATAAADLVHLGPTGELPPWDTGTATLPRETVLIDAHWDLVRRMMWDFVGIVRNDHRLAIAARYLEIFRRSIESYYWDFVLDRDLIELRNVSLIAELIVRCARERRESRGLHYNEDHPERDDARYAADTVLVPPGGRRDAVAGRFDAAEAGRREAGAPPPVVGEG